MMMAPVMAAGGGAPKGLRPSLDIRLAADWHYAESERHFVSASGARFQPFAELPKGTRIRYMAPHLAKADRAKLSADERRLAQYLQVVFPAGTAVEPYLSAIGKWPGVEQVQRPPEISLP